MKLKYALLLASFFVFCQLSAFAQNEVVGIPFSNLECFAFTASHGIYFPTTGKCKAILICVHGLGLYSQAYEDLGQNLAKKDIATYAIDVRGFGAHRRNDKNYRQLDLNSTVKDLEKILAELANNHPGTPIFVLGESMGGAITMKLASLKPKQLSGIICSAPAWKMYKEKRTALKAFAGWSFIQPKRISPAANAIMQEATTKKELRQQWIADAADRLELTPSEALQFLFFIRGTAGCAQKIDNIPVLITQGMQDRLIRVDGAADLFRKIPSGDKELLLVADAEHLIFEEGQSSDLVITALTNWIAAKSQNSTKLAQGVLFSSAGTSNQATKLFDKAKINNIKLVSSELAIAR